LIEELSFGEAASVVAAAAASASIGRSCSSFWLFCFEWFGLSLVYHIDEGF
jgi:hypothetical protein